MDLDTGTLSNQAHYHLQVLIGIKGNSELQNMSTRG